MLGSPWSDGAPGVSQRPIPRGHSFTYRWTATIHGSYWYHSHSRHQIEDGLFGALVVDPYPDAPKPFGEISTRALAVKAMDAADRSAHALLLSDFRNTTGDEAWEITQLAELDPACWDSILINGKGKVTCPDPSNIDSLLSDLQRTQLGRMNVTMTSKGCYPPQLMALAWNGRGNGSAVPHHMFEECQATEGTQEVVRVRHRSSCADESWVALHFIGAFQSLTAAVSIDEHPMWVYAVDGGYVEPRQVQALTVTNGERYSVLVQANRAGQFAIRVASVNDPQIIVGHATLDVEIGGVAAGGRRPAPAGTLHQRRGEADVGRRGVLRPDVGETMGNAQPAYIWSMNSTPLESASLEDRVPFLLDPQPAVNLTVATANDTWVDLVLVTHASPNPAHPIHKHGVKMHLLGVGYGPWTWSSVEEAAAQNPAAFNLVDPRSRMASRP
ncbi:unnamed protein product [Parascedosporium putredinis]|uniref:Laccase n=1 Tax=Parascedosporium putredinis TaxID=1442378 RepID=A0A9P1H491_9PEZI|nr:unnamed protein product [Parascedosporium putredinis]CAI7995802.1 unnamed protein product [Parascedosporium putredinis]